MVKNYIKKISGTSVPTAIRWQPMFRPYERERTVAGEQPDILVDGVWHDCSNGDELVTNGTFDSDLTGWSTQGYADTVPWSNSDGMAKYDPSVSTDDTGGFYQNLSAIEGTLYTIKYTITNTGTARIKLNSSSHFEGASNTSRESGTYEEQLICTDSTGKLEFWTISGDGVVYLENVSVFETAIEPDTAYTTPITYLPITADIDTEGNIVNIDGYDVPTLVEDYVIADKVKAVNEFVGKNACTAWVNFDGTTTPPTIIDSYNVRDVVRTGTGTTDIYFENPMDNVEYGVVGTENYDPRFIIAADSKTTTKFRSVSTNNDNVRNSASKQMLQVFGGKN